MKKIRLTQWGILLFIIFMTVHIYNITTTYTVDAVSSYRTISYNDTTLHIDIVTRHSIYNFEKCSEEIIGCFKSNTFKALRLSDEYETCPVTELEATVYRNRRAIDNGNILFTLYYDTQTDEFSIIK